MDSGGWNQFESRDASVGSHARRGPPLAAERCAELASTLHRGTVGECLHHEEPLAGVLSVSLRSSRYRCPLASQPRETRATRFAVFCYNSPESTCSIQPHTAVFFFLFSLSLFIFSSRVTKPTKGPPCCLTDFFVAFGLKRELLLP